MSLIKLSETSKLDGVKSWSLQARSTCPGARDKGEYVPACAGCYASFGNYYFPAVKNTRAFNKKDWKRPAWVADFVETLQNERYFRWFDSGDIYCKALAIKIRDVIKLTPWVAHWLPTRSHKFPKINAILNEIQALPNAMVRASSDAVDGTYTKGVHGSCIIPTIDALPDGVTLCHAALNQGKCGSCRACYSKDVPVIAYVAHGVVMRSVIKKMIPLKLIK